MYGIVSLLDPDHTALVDNLWAGLARELGVRGSSASPIPHISYHVASSYDLAPLDVVLQRVARQISPFTVRLTGLGIFTGPKPVVYVPVARGSELAACHAQLWSAFAGLGVGVLAYYAPERWLPHVTLAQHDVYSENLPDVVRWLNDRSIDWEVRIDNLTILHDTDSRHQVHRRVPLGG